MQLRTQSTYWFVTFKHAHLILQCTAAYTTVYDCVKATIRTNGFKGPFQGLGATLVRNAPANSVYLGSFEVMKDQMAAYRNCKKTELPAAWVITAGGLGGLLYWLAIYPVDVIKSAMATDSIEPSKRKYPDMATTYKVGRTAHTVMSFACICDHAVLGQYQGKDRLGHLVMLAYCLCIACISGQNAQKIQGSIQQMDCFLLSSLNLLRAMVCYLVWQPAPPSIPALFI